MHAYRPASAALIVAQGDDRVLLRRDDRGVDLETEAELATSITSWSIVLSFTVATTSGLGFELYPAIKASKQDPIVALRHD